MPDRIVTAHRYAWTVPNPNRPDEVYYYTADHGATITVSDEEAARGEALGFLTTRDVLDGVAARRAELQAELERLNTQLADNRANTVPATVLPPEPAVSGVVLTPSQTGIPATTPLPTDQGPIAPSTPSAVDAARAIAAGGNLPAAPTAPVGPTPLIPGSPEANTRASVAAANIAAAETATPGATSTVTDDELAALNVEDTLAHLNQYGGDLDRIAALEDARPRGPRRGVTDAIEALRAATS